MQIIRHVPERVWLHCPQVELGGNLDANDRQGRRELDYLANLLEERILFMEDEAKSCVVDPLFSSLYSGMKGIVSRRP